MKQENCDFQLKINQLRSELGYDFVSLAFAQSAADGFVITWQYASGNLNNRYKRIVLQTGKGIAGLVFKTGKSMSVFNVREQLNPQDLFNYPIVVAEQLNSLIAIPLYEFDRVAGVLLAGYRSEHRFTDQALKQFKQYVNGQFGAFEIKELTFH